MKQIETILVQDIALLHTKNDKFLYLLMISLTQTNKKTGPSL